MRFCVKKQKANICFEDETTPDIAQKEFFSPDISYTPDMSQKYIYKLEKRPICHNVKASTKATVGRDHVRLQ